MPSARVLPIAVPPGRFAVPVGTALARAIEKTGRRAVVVASTDLTHYGANYFGAAHGPLPDALAWMKENDRRFLDHVLKFEVNAIVPEAGAHQNACGAGAVAAATAAAQAMGASKAKLLEYTTSYEVMGGDSAVGYAAIVFTAEADVAGEPEGEASE